MNDSCEALRELARRLLPKGFGVVVLPLSMPAPPMLAEESAAIARAVHKRQKEFAIGRLALRGALTDAGSGLPASTPILPGADRRPVLPNGIHASLAHGGEFCIAVAGWPRGPSVGVDLEPMQGAAVEGLAQAIAPCRMTPKNDPLIGFCVKEAIFKAQFPLTGQMLDFSDVPTVVRGRKARACLGRRLISAQWGAAAEHYLAISLWRG